MRMNRLIVIATIALAAACQNEPAEKGGAAATNSSKPLDIRLGGVETLREWAPKSGGNFLFTQGMSLTMIDGNLGAVKADDGFDIVLVRLDVERNVPDARLPLDAAAAVDDKGTRYKSAVTPLDPLGAKERETIELGFVVPSGTSLRRLELSKDLAIELR